jgi:hypothetical protein
VEINWDAQDKFAKLSIIEKERIRGVSISAKVKMYNSVLKVNQ